MKDNNTLATINDFLHAAIVCAALAVPTVAVASELLSFDREDALTLAVSAITGASTAYGSSLAPIVQN